MSKKDLENISKIYSEIHYHNIDNGEQDDEIIYKVFGFFKKYGNGVYPLDDDLWDYSFDESDSLSTFSDNSGYEWELHVDSSGKFVISQYLGELIEFDDGSIGRDTIGEYTPEQFLSLIEHNRIDIS